MLKHLISTMLLCIGLTCSYASLYAQGVLDGNNYTIQITQIRNNGTSLPKPIEDVINFKSGLISSGFLDEKFLTLNIPINYTVTKDSSYTKEEAIIHYYEVSATLERDNEVLSLSFIIDDINIEGSIKQSRADVLKKQYELTGKMMPRKKKKSQ